MMTEQERKEARREASRRCYLKRKAMLAKKPAKKQEKKPLKKAFFPKRQKKGDNALKLAEKLVKKFSRPVSDVKTLVKEAAVVAKAAFSADTDPAVTEKVRRVLEKKLNLVIDDRVIEPENKAKRIISFNVDGKLFPVPKRQLQDAPLEDALPEPQGEAPADPEDEGEEMPADPDEIKKIIEGDSDTIAMSDDESDEQSDERDDDERDDDERDDDERDESELTDDEREERRWREEKALDDEYAAGRAEAMREFGAQGWGEED